jgi:DnaJ-class molecular chaperone
MTCIFCKGSGWVEVRISGVDRSYICRHCNGTGVRPSKSELNAGTGIAIAVSHPRRLLQDRHTA